MKKIKEGTWSFDPRGAVELLEYLQANDKKWYRVVGDDIFHDHLDGMIQRIKELLKADQTNGGRGLQRESIKKLFEEVIEENPGFVECTKCGAYMDPEDMAFGNNDSNWVCPDCKM